jgi:GNAT superfamily N-acetyltransferase
MVLLQKELLACAFEKLMGSLWRGTHSKTNGMYLVRCGESLGDNNRDQVCIYCICLGEHHDRIDALISLTRSNQVSKVILIGDRDEPGAQGVQVLGFFREWETVVYSKEIEIKANSSQTPVWDIGPNTRLVEITRDNMPISDSFCQDLNISEAALLDPSFVNWMLFTGDNCVGKLQLILCPLLGVFCTLVAVKENQRRRGYFTLMMRAAEDYVSRQNLGRITLFSSSFANDIQLYPKFGYAPIGVYQSFECLQS